MEYSDDYGEDAAEFSDEDDVAGTRRGAEKRRSFRINPGLDPEQGEQAGDRGAEDDEEAEEEAERVPPPPRSAEEVEEQRTVVRSMWELASVFDFISVSGGQEEGSSGTFWFCKMWCREAGALACIFGV